MKGDSLREYLEDRRQELGLTMKDVAKRAKISRQALYKLLKGSAKEARLSTLIQLAKAVEVHPIQMLRQIFWEIKPPPSRLESKYPGDYSGFVEDVTIPDNETVTAGSVFEKIWRINNLGSFVWENRRLVCDDEELMVFRKHGDNLEPLEKIDLVPLEREVPIPTTKPGETVDISVTFQAPIYPCTTISYWKMVDAEGDECFPQLRGLNCRVRVVAI
jgi:transcriptional regulator with XRE-family HTH domain